MIFREWLCRHSIVRVTRYFDDVAPRLPDPKLLYVDRHKARCVVECVKCGKTLDTNQTEFIYEQENMT